MFRRFTFATTLLAAMAGFNGALVAQQATNASNASASTAKKTIGFRLAEWKTSHFHDSAAADQAEETLTSIGCEVKRFAHNGHEDLRYRCPAWKQITVETDQQVEQWNSWLAKQGMLTLIVEPASDMKLSRVSYQLTGTRKLHIHDSEEAVYTQKVLEMLGCQVSTADHDGHIDIEFSCPQWKTLGCANCPTAHGWQDWLKQQGFTTKHSH